VRHTAIALLGTVLAWSGALPAGELADREAVIRALQQRSRLLEDVHFRIPIAVYRNYVRSQLGAPEPAHPAPVAWVAEGARYRLTLDANDTPVLAATLRLRVFQPRQARNVRALTAGLAWQQITVNGRPARPAVRKGWLCFTPGAAGPCVVAARVPLKRGDAYGHRLALDIIRTLRTSLRFDAPTNWDVTLRGAPMRLRGEKGKGTHGELAVPPRTKLEVAYARPVALPPRPARYQLDGEVAWNLDAGRQQVAARIGARILGGKTDRLVLRLPAAAARVSVTGPDVREAQPAPGAVAVFLRGRIAGRTRLDVSYELPLGAGGVQRFARPEIADAHWAGGTFVVTNTAGGSEVVAHSTSGLREMHPGDLPAAARAILSGKPVLAYAITSRRFEAAVDVINLGEFALRESIADLAHYQVLFRPDGSALCKVDYEIRNRTRQFLRLDLPPGARVLLARVNDKPRPVTPVAGHADACLLPLVRSKASLKGLVSFPVQVLVLYRGGGLLREGEVPAKGEPDAKPEPALEKPPPAAPTTQPAQPTPRGEKLGGEQVLLARNYYRAGKDFYDRGQYDKAGESLQKVLTLFPKSPDSPNARRLLANIRMVQGDLAAASRQEKALGHQVKREISGLNVALVEQQQERLEQAREALRAGRAGEAQVQYEAAQSLGEQLVRQGADARKQTVLLRETTEQLGKLQQRQRDQAVRLRERYKALKDKGSYGEALVVGQTLQRVAPGEKQVELRKELEALAVKTAQRRFGPSHRAIAGTPPAPKPVQPQPVRPLDELARKGDKDERTRAHYQMAVTKYAAKDFTSAEHHAKAVLALRPDHGDARELRRKIRVVMGKPIERRMELQRELVDVARPPRREEGPVTWSGESARVVTGPAVPLQRPATVNLPGWDVLRPRAEPAPSEAQKEGTITGGGTISLAGVPSRRRWRRLPIRHADAGSVARVLQDVLDRSGAASRGRYGGERAGAYQLRADPSSGSLLVQADDATFRKVRALTRELDAPTGAPEDKGTIVERLEGRRLVKKQPAPVEVDKVAAAAEARDVERIKAQRRLEPIAVRRARIEDFARQARTLRKQWHFHEALGAVEQILAADPKDAWALKEKQGLSQQMDRLAKQGMLAGPKATEDEETADDLVKTTDARKVESPWTTLLRQPHGWKQLVEDRSGFQASAAGESPTDAALRAKLDRQLERLTFEDIDLADVLAFLREYSDAPIRADWRALEAVGVSRGWQVSVDVRRISVRQGLELVLRDVNKAIPGADVAAVAAGGQVVVTTARQAGAVRAGAGVAKTVTKAYDVRDLLGVAVDGKEKPRERDDAAKDLLKNVRVTLSDSLDVNGTVSFVNGRLVVRASEGGQKRAEGLITKLRELRGPQVELGGNIAKQRATGLVKDGGFLRGVQVDFDSDFSPTVVAGREGERRDARRRSLAARPEFQDFFARNYGWQYAPARARTPGVPVLGTIPLIGRLTASQKGVEDAAGRLVTNLEQKVGVNSTNIDLSAEAANQLGIRFAAGANDLNYAVVDEAQLRTLRELEAKRRRGAPGVPPNAYFQETIVGTDALLASGQRANVSFGGERGNTLDIADNTIALPHEKYVLLDNDGYLTAVRTGEMQHWTEPARRIEFAEVPQEIDVPRVGRLVKLEKTLIKPNDPLTIRATYTWEGAER